MVELLLLEDLHILNDGYQLIMEMHYARIDTTTVRMKKLFLFKNKEIVYL